MCSQRVDADTHRPHLAGASQSRLAALHLGRIHSQLGFYQYQFTKEVGEHFDQFFKDYKNQHFRQAGVKSFVASTQRYKLCAGRGQKSQCVRSSIDDNFPLKFSLN